MKKGKKVSGGKYIKRRKKKKYELAGQKRVVRLSETEKRKTKRVRGGNKKTFLLRVKKVNILEKGDKKAKKAEIKNVIETPSNRFLARQNIITKGTILETSAGRVRVTNRPSQEGVVNGILVKEE
jgi:small subunit ribosomal protein S8e